ncbi:hypothetical protein G6F22_012676 [Rhizopus arrhizus]|nr:hypothetical protein G6F22_012676 [Rhizopus arrhizus]
MRPIPTLLALSLAALPAFASAADFDNWPTKYTFGDGTELAATANIAYDYNDFSSASGLEDDDAVRRKEFGATPTPGWTCSCVSRARRSSAATSAVSASAT